MEIKRYENYITWKDKQGNFNTECNRASLPNDLSLTIPTNALTKVCELNGGGKIMRIRKLVPVECMKLMGFTREDYQAMRDTGMTDAQIYHCAGDSLVVPLCAMLYAQMLPISEEKAKFIVERYIDEIKES